ncbi:MAG: AMP-binding protein [Acidimicrobiales bacterium]
MNLARIIEEHPPGAPALLCARAPLGEGEDPVSGPVTYGELGSAAARWRQGLAQCGVGRSDRVAILLENSADFVLAYLAVLGLGAVAVPLNPASPGPELERELRAVQPVAAVVGSMGSSTISSLPGSVAALRAIVVIEAPASLSGAGAGAGAWAGAWAGAFGGDGVGPLIVDPSSWSSLPGIEVVDCLGDDLAILLFTAGTAGSPKAAQLTHANLASNLDQIQHHPGRAVHVDDVSLGVLPMFHIYGLNAVLGLTLAAGASLVLVAHFDTATVGELVQRCGVTILAGVPSMFESLSASDLPGDVFSGLRAVISGASALDRHSAETFRERFGHVIVEGYGLTEASPVVTSCIPGEELQPGSIGPPLPGMEVRLVDEDGLDAMEGDMGEIWVRGPNVFSGYWEDPAATALAVDGDGWLRTGDVAVAGSDGYLHIVDRAKDLIIVSGFNVYPAEVEEVLIMHPGVAEVAVVGGSGQAISETVNAYIVCDGPTSPDRAELVELCHRHLARYKCPTSFTFVESIPHGLTGKLLRRALRQP